MRHVRVLSFLLVWYVASTALLFMTTRFVGTVTDGNRWPLLVLLALEVAATISFGATENFVSRYLGKFGTLVLLAVLLWCSLPSLFYVSMFVYGETL
jgi:glycopeptide antibiotics resistance protein